MDFERRSVSMEILDPARGFQPVRLQLEQRWDPLTGQGCRLLPPLNLFPPAEGDLTGMVTRAAGSCPFCPERVEAVTPRFPETVIAAGRLRRGEALLFPNLHPYARYSSVAVFSPRRHLLPLTEMTPQLVGDNLAVQVAFAHAVTGHDPQARWVSVNANHLPPSGSSVLHPHTQGSVHPFPTTMQRLLSELPADRLTDYIAAERATGRRYLGSTGTVDWVVSFAPSGPAELRAVLSDIRSPEQLGEERVAELASGIATALTFYAELGFSSYNMALYGTPSDAGGLRTGGAGHAAADGVPVQPPPVVQIRRDVAGAAARRRSGRHLAGRDRRPRRRPVPALTAAQRSGPSWTPHRRACPNPHRRTRRTTTARSG